MQKKKKKELETCFLNILQRKKIGTTLHISFSIKPVASFGGSRSRGHGRHGLPDTAPRLPNHRMLEKLGFRKRLKTMLLQLSQIQTIIKEVEEKKKEEKKTQKKTKTKKKDKKKRRRGQEGH